MGSKSRNEIDAVNAANKGYRKKVEARIWSEARKEVWYLSMGGIAMIASSSVNQGTDHHPPHFHLTLM
jgi:hypothetical protein